MVVKVFSGVILVLGIIFAFLALLAKPIPDHPFFEHGEGPLVMAHQGGKGLRPDNTMTAFEHAWDLNTDVLEMDLHSTKDSVLVLIHDDTVDDTTDGSGEIQAFNFRELQQLDAAFQWTPDEGVSYPYREQDIQIPSLAEVFDTFPDARMNIEIKQAQPSIVGSFCDMLREHHMTDQVLVASFDQDTIRNFREACPEVATSAGEQDVIWLYALSLIYLERLYNPSAEAVQVPEYRGRIHVLTPRFVQAAKNRNMAVHVWTVNEAKEMQRFLDLGVDGIITDRPDHLLALLGR